MWWIFLKFLFFFFGVCQVNAIAEYKVTNDLKNTFQQLKFNGLEYYEIGENALYTKDVLKYFNLGEIIHSFECTFYLDPKKMNETTEFSLIHLYSKLNHFEMFLNFLIEKELIKIVFKKGTTEIIYKFHFNKTVDFLDGKWHSVMYGLHKTKQDMVGSIIDCWVDCNKLSYPMIYNIYSNTKNGNEFAYFKDLTLAIGKKHNEINQSIPIKISKMRFHGYSKMPEYAFCEDIVQHNKGKESEENQYKKIHILHNKNSSIYVIDSEEINASDSEDKDLLFYNSMESTESNDDYYNVSSIMDEQHEEKHSLVISIFGFILFCSLSGIIVLLIKKYY